MHSSGKKDRDRGFTLIELLVVIGIITVLIAILLPVVNKARAQAQQVVCASNQRQITMACLAYAAENRNILPIPCAGVEVSQFGISNQVKPYQAIWMVDSYNIDLRN